METASLSALRTGLGDMSLLTLQSSIHAKAKKSAVEDWVALPQPHYDLGVQMLFTRHNGAYYHELIPNNIALEFGRSWLTDVPDSIYKLKRENSARGYLSHLVSMNNSVEIDVEGIWIIDKEAKWFAGLSKHHNTVYRDCDTEYIEVKWDDVVNYTSNGSSATASKFIQKLDRLSLLDCFPSPESFDHFAERDGPPPQDFVRLLVRRDNEVKDPTIGRSFSRDEFGWIIHSDDEDDDEEE
ncbi:hypothetical protein EDB82DRAFT_478520 [Fusarium venenatum]|uniref:uncharacterized protein n=1 Tax=Fusarium venenatum TaxID=56646 RepID=UPI001DD5203B|nr:hypothetical protein EDB82DRAFT_478520 [Fusarium venenatum]